MTLDEAIQHCREQARGLRNRGEVLAAMSQDGTDCALCAAEHEQLAKWLEELQQRRAYGAPWLIRLGGRGTGKRLMQAALPEIALAQKRAPIIAVDFDGTLCENAWPEIGEAKWNTIQALIAAQAAGARLILWTNRVGARLREAVVWAQARELEFDAVNENLPEIKAAFTTDCRKVYADIYLDDKAAQPSAAVLSALFETARATMNEAGKAGEEERG